MPSLDYKLDKYDASIADCSQVLSTDPQHIKGLVIEKEYLRY
jgi:hypothetical protein